MSQDEKDLSVSRATWEAFLEVIEQRRRAYQQTVDATIKELRRLRDGSENDKQRRLIEGIIGIQERLYKDISAAEFKGIADALDDDESATDD